MASPFKRLYNAALMLSTCKLLYNVEYGIS